MKRHFLPFVMVTCLTVISCTSDKDYSSYVNPFIGNADNGHTFPGACVPFGLIQAGPESGIGSWRYCSGYNYDDEFIEGFAQTHLNGTGVPDLGDIFMFPFARKGETKLYKSHYDKSSQTAQPGYYAVSLTDAGVDVEITATERTAFYRYKFSNKDSSYILLDLQRGLSNAPDRVLSAEMNMLDEYTITGYNEVKGWVQRKFFYVIKFDRPYVVDEILPQTPEEKGRRMILAFDLEGQEYVQTKVALSTVSVEGAWQAMEKENSDWDFNTISQEARNKWNKALSKVTVKGTPEQKTNFYTALYHLFVQPNNIADVDGKYRGVNDSIYSSPSGNYYSTLSLWDTYRAAHPLYTLLMPERVDDFVNTMLAHFNVQGYLPIWTLWGKENYCMIGNHAIPVIADACLKGFRGFDINEAYHAVKTTSMSTHPYSDWDIYNRYGYYPSDLLKTESVSRTLESAYDDYCVAQMARMLDKKEDFDYFMHRSSNYKNVFDTVSGFMRGKDSAGNWRTPFSPLKLSHFGTIGGDFTEANSWQYSWHVQQDIEGLIKLMGGKDAFEDKLDKLFSTQADISETGEVLDVTGLIGQYAHGNEPCHHIIYLYQFINKSSKTEELIREVFDRFYLPKPNGLCGNDDCGQMSAWYIFSAMGFYPVNPVGGEYIIGAPQIAEMVLSLPEGRKFVIKAENLSRSNKYVESVLLNGHELSGFRIKHQDIMKGGELVFKMTDKKQSFNINKK